MTNWTRMTSTNPSTTNRPTRSTPEDTPLLLTNCSRTSLNHVRPWESVGGAWQTGGSRSVEPMRAGAMACSRRRTPTAKLGEQEPT